MDILVKTQTTADINIIVPLMINTGAPDTGATLTVKAINPDGTENATFTAPTITEIIASGGVYKLNFPTGAATPLFTQANENNPYTLLVKSATSGSTGYRAVRVYCVDRLPGEIAKSTEIAALDTLIDGAIVTLEAVPTLAEILAGGVALDSTVAKDATVAKAATALSNAVWTDAKAGYLTGTVALDSTVAKAATVPSLAQIEASTVLAKEASSLFLMKCIKNKKKIKVVAGVLYLIIYDDDDVTEILRKAIKDVAGADVLDPAAGVIALENKTTV